MNTITYRILTAALLDVLALYSALHLTRWRGVQRQLILETAILAVAVIAITLLVPVLKRGSTTQILVAILVGFLPGLLLVRGLIELFRSAFAA